jgi:hypothetical protein
MSRNLPFFLAFMAITLSSTSAFAPSKSHTSRNFNCLLVSKNVDNDQITTSNSVVVEAGKIIAAAALSFAILIGPSPALADGEIQHVLKTFFAF